MYLYTQGHCRLVSTGAYIPEQRVTSRELMDSIDSKSRFGLSPDWLERTMGVRERRVAPEHMLPSDMAAQAARQALESASLTAGELDVVIYTGIDRDYFEPATAHIVQAKLGADRAAAFDVTNACHGFMNGVHLMDALIATGQVRRGLVVTGEQAFRATRKAVETLKATTDRDVFVKLCAGLTLGDAGAAVVLGPKLDPDSGFMGFMLQSQGRYFEVSTCGKRCRETPLEADLVNGNALVMQMLEAMYAESMVKFKWRPEQIAKYVHHQAGVKILKEAARYAHISPDIVVNLLPTLGNMATANIPVILDTLMRNREVRAGEKVFITGVGSGLVVSQTGLIWDAA